VSVTNPGNQSGTVGTAASLHIQASDSASGQTLTYSASGLPAGLSINSSSGLISGTPTTSGSYSVTISAKDTTGASGSTSFSWKVNATGPQPPSTGTLDNFQRANQGPPPSSSWSLGPLDFTSGDGLVVLNNALARRASGSYRQGDYWNPATYGPDSEVWATAQSVGSSPYDAFNLYLRLTNIGPKTTNGYGLAWSGNNKSNNISIQKFANGAFASALASFTQNLSPGDSLALQAIGSTLYAWYRPAGGSWTLLGSATDTTYSTAGYLGADMAYSQNTTLSSFGGGALTG
jgi:hypothetical protein